jgi:hypothetical protein
MSQQRKRRRSTRANITQQLRMLQERRSRHKKRRSSCGNVERRFSEILDINPQMPGYAKPDHR